MLDNADDPAATTTWLEHVTNDDYLASLRGPVSRSVEGVDRSREIRD